MPSVQKSLARLALACGMLPIAAVAADHDSSRWEKYIARFEAADKKQMPQPGGILFIGSSSIRMWKTLKQDFPGLPVINRGFGVFSMGDELVDELACPICKEDTEVANVGFNNCKFKYKGKLCDGSSFETPPKTIGDEYHEPADGNDDADFPVSRSVSLASLHLPSSTELAASDVDRIADAVLEWVETHG